MNNALLKIGIRYNAIYLSAPTAENKRISEAAAGLVSNLAKYGYTVDEGLLHQLNNINAREILRIYEVFTAVLQLNNNWAPLVKGWDVPTGEGVADHWLTRLANVITGIKGQRLACGHLIPENTFPLERYNGCPFCGTPFELSNEVYTGQGSKMKVLSVWSDADALALLANLLQSKTALDATQADTLKTLLTIYPVPDVTIGMKETMMLVIDALIEGGKGAAAGALFRSPADILRYLWYKQTSFLQLVRPAVIVRRQKRNHRYLPAGTAQGAIEEKAKLKLKYDRATSRMVAQWINELPLAAEKAAEIMHPQRDIWVRFIRALRLAEYSQKPGMEQLKTLMDVFYNQSYTVWAGRVEHFRLKTDAEETFRLLKERPGLFARSLFSNMLWFGKDATLDAFREITDKVPARLLYTLSSYAQTYFTYERQRIVKPLGGVSKSVFTNRLLWIYSHVQLKEMSDAVEALTLQVMEERYTKTRASCKTIFIDPSLHFMPMPVGDRSETVQDLSSALTGMRFPVTGNDVRLFMQWGNGLPAQHMDMDLSCQIAYANKLDICSYSNLAPKGARHSGDIREIPDEVGTAEYINLNINALQNAGAQYVSFVCNAYSNGAITPNLVVGWMNSANPMKISAKTGVAYDPSCVQHQVRITRGLAKGLLFGVLDVSAREIIWMEMPFQGQVAQSLNIKDVQLLFRKLNSKLSVGAFLNIKANAQQLRIVDNEADADEVYNRDWAMDFARVSQLLID